MGGENGSKMEFNPLLQLGTGDYIRLYIQKVKHVIKHYLRD